MQLSTRILNASSHLDRFAMVDRSLVVLERFDGLSQAVSMERVLVSSNPWRKDGRIDGVTQERDHVCSTW